MKIVKKRRNEALNNGHSLWSRLEPQIRHYYAVWWRLINSYIWKQFKWFIRLTALIWRLYICTGGNVTVQLTVEYGSAIFAANSCIIPVYRSLNWLILRDFMIYNTYYAKYINIFMKNVNIILTPTLTLTPNIV